MAEIKFAFVDERVKAIGTSRLRSANAKWLSTIGDSAYLIQDSSCTPLAVLVSYETYMRIQEELEQK